MNKKYCGSFVFRQKSIKIYQFVPAPIPTFFCNVNSRNFVTASINSLVALVNVSFDKV